jgi:hypothetical protein
VKNFATSVRWHLLPVVIVGAILAGGCNDTSVDSTPVAAPSSFELIQTRIFSKSCALSGCHTAGSQMAEESGLVLDAGVAYASLVNVAPKNANALDDGMLRVKPGSFAQSFLFHKLEDVDDHHAGRYGNPMPLGRKPISAGQLEYIRLWIDAGAPDTGVVADSRLLDDTIAIEGQPFTPLALPAQGYQLKVGPFDVQPNFERELFVYSRVGNTDDAYVNRIETKMRRGSHHLELLSFITGTPKSIIPPVDLVRDIRNPDGTMNEANMKAMGYHIFFGGSMTQYGTYTFPQGVALRLAPNAAIDFNSHYVNKTSSIVTGEAYANLHTIDKSEVQHEALPIVMSNQNLPLPPRQQTTLTKTFTASKTMTVFLLTSHTHKLGKEFLIKISGGARNGEVIYRSTDWQHPLIKVFDTPIVLKPGEGLTSVVTYYNDTDQNVNFGLTSEDEMNFIFGYYY